MSNSQNENKEMNQDEDFLEYLKTERQKFVSHNNRLYEEYLGNKSRVCLEDFLIAFDNACNRIEENQNGCVTTQLSVNESILKDEISKLKAKNEDLQQEVEVFKSEASLLKAENRLCRNKFDRLVKENEEPQSVYLIQKLQSDLKLLKSENKELIERIYELQKSRSFSETNEVSTFQPYQKVLARDFQDEFWLAELYSHSVKEDGSVIYICMGGTYKQCIHYEGNEHLLATTDSQQ